MEAFWEKDIQPVLGPDLWRPIEAMGARQRENLREIRIRLQKPLSAVGMQGVMWLDEANPISRCQLDRVVERMCQGSVYARESEFAQGFLTLPGGHRVGMAGRLAASGGSYRLVPGNITSLNIRLSRQLRGAASQLLTRLGGPDGIPSCLIFSPPGAGKTTLLRDLVRQIAVSRQVSVVDERGELAGSDELGPRLDLGPLSDVLEFCPKAVGIMWVIRSMGPQVVATDELGAPADLSAVEEASRSGVTVLATCHGRSVKELLLRPGVGEMIRRGCFALLIGLGFSRGVGTIEEVVRPEEAMFRAGIGGNPSDNGRHLSGTLHGRPSRPENPGSRVPDPGP